MSWIDDLYSSLQNDPIMRQDTTEVYPLFAQIIKNLGFEKQLRAYLSNVPFLGDKIADQLMAPLSPLSMGVGGTLKVPYGKAPNSLMGFSKDQIRQKGFADYNYKYELPVRVQLKNGEVFYDAINGINKAHAMERARRNWEGAEIAETTMDRVNKYYER